MGTVTGVKTNDSVVALTFDDGPHPESTVRLLELLAKYDAKGTFFMVGEMARRYPEVVREVAKRGHAIGNHTWDHPSMPTIGRRERRRQIGRCKEAISPYDCGLFRPPYGHQNFASGLDARCGGYDVVGWSMDSGDWKKEGADALADRIANGLSPGAILLMHDAVYDLRKDEGRVGRIFSMRWNGSLKVPVRIPL